MLISAVNVMLHVMLRGIPRARQPRAVCGHGSRCMCARTGFWRATALMGRFYVCAVVTRMCDRVLTIKPTLYTGMGYTGELGTIST